MALTRASLTVGGNLALFGVEQSCPMSQGRMANGFVLDDLFLDRQPWPSGGLHRVLEPITGCQWSRFGLGLSTSFQPCRSGCSTMMVLSFSLLLSSR